MLQCSLWLRQPAGALASSRLLFAAHQGSRPRQGRQRVWRQPDVRQMRDQPKLNRLEGILQLSQHNLPDPSTHRQGHTYTTDAQTALLSRPGGRASRLSDPRARFHYKRQNSKFQFSTKGFRKFYNSS